ncbi:hypothetical protein QZH41_003430, partial [Actinostola sp. cb2023]
MQNVVSYFIERKAKDDESNNDYKNITKLEQFYNNHISLELAYPRVANGLPRLSIGEVEGIAVDPVHRNIFWTDFTYAKIEVSSYNGSNRKTLYNKNSMYGYWGAKIMYNPKAIVVHPTKGFIFWVDSHYFHYWGFYYVEYQEIGRSTLAGTDYRALHNFYGQRIDHNKYYPVSLTIDFAADRLYYFDPMEGKMGSMDFQGYNIQTHHVSGHHPLPSEMALIVNMLYWADRKSNSIERMQVGTWRRLTSFGWLTSGHLFGIAGYNYTNEKEVKVRLANGRYPSEGRVEIKYGSRWGTICNDNFDISEANVICRMLNYTR